MCRKVIPLLIFGACLTATLWGQEIPATRPNIILVLADDLGYSDLGCYGGEAATPTLDSLAREGLRFTDFYNTARCWPTRACLMTGYYAQQVRRDTVPGARSGGQGKRPAWAKLLPEYLKSAGYRCYHSGKWHVDGPVLAGGFDESYSLDDHDRYFGPKNHKRNDQPLPSAAGSTNYYATTAIADYAIQMLETHGKEAVDQPFFLYLAFTAPHFPLQAPEQEIALYTNTYAAGWTAIRQQRYANLKRSGIFNRRLSSVDPDAIPSWNLSEAELKTSIGEVEVGRALPWESLTSEQQRFQARKMAIHAAMIHRMDIEIGRVLEQANRLGRAEDTLVIFLSDNGASAEQIIRGDRHSPALSPGSAGTFLGLGPGWSSAANTPFRFHKSWVHEGGIATPLIVHWPGKIGKPGSLRTTPGHAVDIPVTLLEIAGVKTERSSGVPPLAGRSLLPILAKDTPFGERQLWWYHDGNRALRVGNWKLVADHSKPWELFDLGKDRGETRNLAAKRPDRVKAMAEEWERLLEEFKEIAQDR